MFVAIICCRRGASPYLCYSCSHIISYLLITDKPYYYSNNIRSNVIQVSMAVYLLLCLAKHKLFSVLI